ncbi:MAG: HdeD family acid-resistance protein [Pirellulales bacterium]|jgi:uncharacterized membrane protein HdeD (DUF308 family)
MAENKIPGVSQLIFSGIVMLIFGVIAVGSPQVAGAAVVYVIGGLILMVGVLQIVHGFQADDWPDKALPLVLGILMSLCGISLLLHPFIGMAIIALMMAVFFVVEGLWKIYTSFSYKPAPGWLMMLLSGVITLFLGGMIWRQWPLSGVWAVGILVGVDLLCTGASMLVLGLTLRQVEKDMDEVSAV